MISHPHKNSAFSKAEEAKFGVELQSGGGEEEVEDCENEKDVEEEKEDDDRDGDEEKVFFFTKYNVMITRRKREL